MTHETRVYWPFDVISPDQRTPLQDAEVRFFEATYRGGYQPFHGRQHCELGFGSTQDHDARFIRRGGRGRHWEPRLFEHGTSVTLGPLFGLAESTCLIIDGFEDLTTFALRWLSGDPLKLSLNGLFVYAKRDLGTPLSLGLR